MNGQIIDALNKLNGGGSGSGSGSNPLSSLFGGLKDMGLPKATFSVLSTSSDAHQTSPPSTKWPNVSAQMVADIEQMNLASEPANMLTFSRVKTTRRMQTQQLGGLFGGTNPFGNLGNLGNNANNSGSLIDMIGNTVGDVGNSIANGINNGGTNTNNSGTTNNGGSSGSSSNSNSNSNSNAQQFVPFTSIDDIFSGQNDQQSVVASTFIGGLLNTSTDTSSNVYNFEKFKNENTMLFETLTSPSASEAVRKGTYDVFCTISTTFAVLQFCTFPPFPISQPPFYCYFFAFFTS